MKSHLPDDSEGSIKDPSYASGNYFEDPHRHSEDSDFKSKQFLDFFRKIPAFRRITSYADIGCGSGDIVTKISDGLKEDGVSLKEIKGYDISPHVRSLKAKGISFICEDFCETHERVDLVTMFDIFEHVPDPISFIKQSSLNCKIIGFHIPLDYSLNTMIRNMFRSKLSNPGHLVLMDTTWALNLLTLSGLRIIDYQYTFGFLAPSGHKTLKQKLIYPFRYLLAKMCPWLLSKTLGGASLLVLALTKKGLTDFGEDVLLAK